jgi:hypothetical protein
MVPGERIELPTNGLQNRCSTAELTRQIKGLATRDALVGQHWGNILSPLQRGSHHCPRCVRTPSASAAAISERSGISSASAAAVIFDAAIGPFASCSRTRVRALARRPATALLRFLQGQASAVAGAGSDAIASCFGAGVVGTTAGPQEDAHGNYDLRTISVYVPRPPTQWSL